VKIVQLTTSPGKQNNEQDPLLVCVQSGTKHSGMTAYRCDYNIRL